MIGILFSSFLILLVLGVPIAFAIGLGALVPIIMQGNIPLSLVVSRMFGGIDSFPLMAIPFFVLTGTLAGACKLTDRIAALAAFMVGNLRAGLAHVNIVASMLFGGVTGSAVADAAATGSMMIPAMRSQGYPAAYSAAVTAASSVIGSIIPPSTMMIIYGFLTGVSTGRMFVGAIIPGIMVGLALMLVAHFQAVRLGIGYDANAKPRTFGGLWLILKDSGPAMVVPVIIIGGIVGGFFTPTEAGVVAVVTILVLGSLYYRSFTLARLRTAFLTAGYTTAMVMMILAASTVFANLLTRARFQSTLIEMLSTVSSIPEVQMLLVIALLLFLTLFIDATAVLIMFAAPLAAVFSALGYDPVHSGVVVIVACLIGGVTPPVGTLLFIAAGIARISVGAASRAIFPFVLALIAVTLIILFVPPLVTWLPSIAFN